MMPNCSQCSAPFEITPDDLAFYEKVSPVFNGKTELIPPPTLCPDCRRQRRLTWRNEKKLYHRKCDLTGRQIISIYSPDKPFKVFDSDEWHSDKWDPMTFGRPFDFTRPFFAQWEELRSNVPLPSMNLRYQNENSDYTNLSARNKNCYLIFAANDNEDCYYSTYLHRSQNVVDCFFTFDSQRCYECIDCYNGYNLLYAKNCKNCSDSALLSNCQSCKNCLGCVNLKNKQYYIFNQQCTEEEFTKKYAEAIRSRQELEQARAEFLNLEATLPHPFLSGHSNDNVSGDHISSSKNVHDSYDVTYCEDCKYCVWWHRAKNCYDCYGWALPGELGYENHLVGNGFYNVRFSESCANDVSNLLYCRYCENSTSDCFGCLGLVHKKYCILNTQYTQQEYEELMPRIIEHMRKPPYQSHAGSGTGQEWGEFFPAALSPYGYNETVAQEYFPLSEEQVRSRGWNWRQEDEEEKQYLGPTVPIPDTVADVADSITGSILTCEVTKRPYKIIPQELQFYREMNISLPVRCFDQRHKERMALRNPRRLWDRECAKCKKEIMTSYSQDRPEIVYCESCYLETVY